MKKLSKNIFSVILFVLMLGFLTMEKTSLMWLLRVLRHPDVSFEAGYFTIGLLILAPYFMSILIMLWNISFLTIAKEPQLPPLNNLLLGITACIVESACVVTFTTVVAPVLPVFIVLPVMSAVLSVSVVVQDFKKSPLDERVRYETRRCLKKATIAGIFVGLAPITAASILWFCDVISWLQAVCMSVSVLGLATVWTPAVQIQMVTTSRGFNSSPKRVQLFYGFLRIVFIIVFLGLEIFLRCDKDTTMREMLNQFGENFDGFLEKKLVIPLVINIFLGVFAHGFTYLSVAFCQPIAGLILPSLFSTFSAILLCVCIFSKQYYFVDELRDFGDMIPLLIAAGILATAWAVPYIIKTSGLVKKPGSLYIPYETLFLSYGWNSVFFDQHLLLSYNHEGFNRVFAHKQDSATQRSRIYICTTMYREADYEMERLLFSLEGLSISPKFIMCDLEAHIFMDNGVKVRELQSFAQQLIGLLVEKVKLNLESSRCLETPYGVQIRWMLPGGMPLFIHLKDPVKVKPKKRWSQCMYIHYVMRYRKCLNDVKTVSGKVSRTAQPETKSCEEKIKREEFELKGLQTKIDTGFPTYTDLVTNYHLAHDSDDQGFASVDESTPPISHSSSQAKLDTDSCKESTDSTSDDLNVSDKPGGVVNRGFQPDENVHYLKMVNKPPARKGKGKGKGKDNVEKGLDGESDPWSRCSSSDLEGTTVVDMDAEYNDDHTYILATDADMEFKDEAVLELLHLCNSDNRLGGACGRTHPIGKHCSSIVWHQIFEYAKDFWMIKNAQNVIGSVMCAPGCFSLYRASALKEVMDKYASPTRTPFTVYVKDTGEDRWMATLMMIHGWRLRFTAFADNTTYCPDTFEEFFKQRRRWILSDIANALLVVQNLLSLIKNNDCFTFVYVAYLLNMFVNNVITPGTAIVMITAGMELVFDVPYAYTTLPMAILVYAYAIACTRTNTRTQTILTSVMTIFMGSIFFSIAVWGSYKIVAAMVYEAVIGHFRFQQHYVILMLTLSLVYAALAHPRECYEIVYGFAYLFIFPAMHVLLPIYSIANIIDQSWGTRDSNKAKIPKMMCLPSFKKFRRKKKNKGNKNEDENEVIKDAVASQINEMAMGSVEEQSENQFWLNMRMTLIGNDVNTGLEKAALAEGLRKMRNRSLTGMLIINALWLGLLSYFYMGVSSSLSRLNVYGVISGVLYGFTLTIQVFGLTVCRINYLLRKLARCLYSEERPMWVCEKK